MAAFTASHLGGSGWCVESWALGSGRVISWKLVHIDGKFLGSHSPKLKAIPPQFMLFSGPKFKHLKGNASARPAFSSCLLLAADCEQTMAIEIALNFDNQISQQDKHKNIKQRHTNLSAVSQKWAAEMMAALAETERDKVGGRMVLGGYLEEG